MSINQRAALGCEIKRLEHAPGEASMYMALVKFEQSVVLSLARAITPDIVSFPWTELAERGRNKRAIVFQDEITDNQTGKNPLLSIGANYTHGRVRAGS